MKQRPTASDLAAERVAELTREFGARNLTTKQLTAIRILLRCMENQRAASPPAPFVASSNSNGDSSDKRGLWISGDLAGGSGGAEFVYSFLPVRFIEGLLDITDGLPEDLAEIYAGAATTYFLNTLRSAIDEAVTNVFYESGMVIKEMVDSFGQEDPVTFVREERFADMIKSIINEGNKRKSDRLHEAMWEVSPRAKHRFAQLNRHYQDIYPAWDHAADVYKANKAYKLWKTTVRNEIKAQFTFDLPPDLVSLLSERLEDHEVVPPSGIELTPSGLALEHSARLCDLPDFARTTGHLRALKCSQEKESSQMSEGVN